jgi:hypothetical protein
MDPNMTLHELRELCAELQQIAPDPDRPLLGAVRRSELAGSIAEKFDALDGWLTRGGFIPSAWTEGRDHR